MISRRNWLRVAASGVAFGTLSARHLLAAPAAKQATVYKSATCSCCKKWVEHLQKAGYTVTSNDVPDVNVYKKRYAVAEDLWSCHTAIVSGGYVVEGHVPADVIDKFLADAPKAPKDLIGLAVPGMPSGSPGMESPTPEKYDILAFTKTGKTSIYAKR